MDWIRKNNKRIEFFHDEHGITETFPIIESKNLKLNWIKRVREDMAQTQISNTNAWGFQHLARCPGIFDLFKYGYIVSLHKDLIIKPSKTEFECIIPTGETSLRITGQHKTTVNLISKPPWSADFIMKIDTGWHVIAPKGLKFLMLPIAYPDNFDFTATTGILNPALSTTINFQLFWNATESETLIPSGTPLGHLIPLTEKKYKWTQRTMNNQDRIWIENLDT